MRRHRNILLRGHRILRLPQTRHRLPLRVEPQSVFTVEVRGTSASHGLLVASKAEHRQGHRDGNIDAQLACFDLFLEETGGGAGAGEDRGAVAVGVGVDEVDGFVGGVDVQADKDRAEDLFGVAFHVGGYVGDDGGADLEGKMLA